MKNAKGKPPSPGGLKDKDSIVEQNWYLRLRNLMMNSKGKPPGPRGLGDQDPTADFPRPSPFTLVPGGLMLQVGVVSTVGRVREHNEDNYYVPGRNSVR